jgi:pimeloyl-ACP methyl ester carboxylesterase
MSRHPRTTVLLILVCLAATSGCAGHVAGETAAASAVEGAGSDVLAFGYAELGAYALAYLCRGEGYPVVVIEDALGVPALESGGWWDIMAEIAPLTRICVYDRAGLGLSGQAPAGPRTSQTAVEDLRTLLHAAQVPGPYVLVGHAVGGYHALLHASQHPGEMAGLVLINGYHPDQWTAFQALLPAEVPGEPARLSRLRYLQAQPAANTEGLDVFESAAQVSRSLAGRPQPPLGDLPLVVVTRSPESGLAPFMPPEISVAGGPVWQALQAELAGLSSSGTQEWAEKGGHSLHLQEPELVVAAIWQVVEAARGAHD